MHFIKSGVNSTVGDINLALVNALDFSEIFLKDVNIGSTNLSYQALAQGSTDVPAGKVLNASELVANFGNNPYLYEVGMILAEYGALGDSSRDATNIAIEIFKFLEIPMGNRFPNSFSIGDEKNNQLIKCRITRLSSE